MAAPQPVVNSSSPQWDNRNRAFIPPTQLRQQSPNHDLSNPPQQYQNTSVANIDMASIAPSQPSYQPSVQPQARPRPQNSVTGTTHTRTSSFFSFRKNPNSSQAVENKLGSSADTRSATLVDGSRPGSAVNEFGTTTRTTQYDAQSIASKQPPTPDNASQLGSANEGQQQRLPRAQPPQAAPLHPEIRSVVQLTVAHSRKVYYSGPLVRRLERQPDGSRPAKDEGWTDVWAQLGGTILSIWDMKMIADASKEGKEVPPTYINVQDAFVQVLGSVTVPATASTPAKRYTDVLTLNTAGSNLLLFSCPSTGVLISWAAALRLSAWEKSHLEEIYTAHLLRIRIPDVKEAPSQLVKGRMEGWVQIRLAGQTDWKRYYMMVSGSSASFQPPGLGRSHSLTDSRSSSPNAPRPTRRISNFFSRDTNTSGSGVNGGGSGGKSSLPQRPLLQIFMGNRPKDKRAPVLTMRDITQAFAVYPERPEMITVSTLIKLEGLLGDEAAAGGMRSREAWIMVMPETEGKVPSAEMLKWIMAFHDAFELYGRPRSYTWDPRDPASQMFGYPVGPHKDLLFLERESAETMDPRDDRTSAVRNRLASILLEKMRAVPGFEQSVQPGGPPLLPPIANMNNSQPQQQNGQADGSAPLLPSLDFNSPPPELRNRGALTPITERTLESVDYRASRSFSGEQHPVNKGISHGAPSTVVEETSSENPSVLGVPISKSPPPTARNPAAAAGTPTTSGPSVNPSVNTGLPKGAMNRVEEPTSPDLPPLPKESRASGDSSKSPPPTTSPKVTNQVQPSSTQLPSASTLSPQSAQAKSPDAPSPQQSVLTNPYSAMSSNDAAMQQQQQSGSASPQSKRSPAERTGSNTRFPGPPNSQNSASPISAPYSVLTSPHSPQDAPMPSITGNINEARLQPHGPAPSHVTASSVRTNSTEVSGQSLFDEAGALYYMQQFEGEGQNRRNMPATISEDAEESTSEPTPNNQSPRERSPAPQARTAQPASMRRGAPGLLDRQMTTASMASSSLDPLTSHGVAPKQTGPRGMPANQNITARRSRDDDEQSSSSAGQPSTVMSDLQKTLGMNGDDNADALAALSFLDQDTSPIKPVATSQPVPPPPPPPPQLRTPSPPVDSDGINPIRSSFAPSRQAAERKARVQAQEAASHAAAHRPGRANGKQKTTPRDKNGWSQSSDEEEEEEEEEEDDDDADSDAPRPPRGQPPPHAVPPVVSVEPLHPRPRDLSPQGRIGSTGDVNAHPQPRQTRTLPPVPATRPGGSEFLYGTTPSRRAPSEQYSESHPRSYYDQGQHIRQQSEAPVPGAAQQNVWSQVLQPGQNAADLNTSNRDTFVQIEPPSQTMTKAFAPQGLLSAGIQDKEDRSAKKQEEIARENGASLINVPNKPPPPQTGLLGAITAHERERKREGGVGAALTEREREKRVAEERQRKLDEFQRQQLEMAQSGAGGSMYQQPQFTGYNPMMVNPMMMGMNPMMTGMMSYPGMMPGFGNQQHMFAAQQAAAQAYQQAMMTFSQAGSQAGGPVDGAGPSPLNPMMTGGAMSMFDPRMSMMGMPMMGSPYGMGQQPLPGQQGMPGMQGGFPGMAGNPMQGMNPMGMQNTGGSGFDARFTPTETNGHQLSPFQGQAVHGPSSRNSSPARRGSPALRSYDHPGTRPSSGQSSPRPPPS